MHFIWHCASIKSIKQPCANHEKKNKETNVGITDKTTLVKINKQIVKAELFPEIDHKKEIKFINLDKIPIYDKATFDLLQKSNTTAVFQLWVSARHSTATNDAYRTSHVLVVLKRMLHLIVIYIVRLMQEILRQIFRQLMQEVTLLMQT